MTVRSGFPFSRTHKISRDWPRTSGLASLRPNRATASCWQDMACTCGETLWWTPSATLKYSNISSNASVRCGCMATVRVPDKGIQLTDAGEVRRFLHAHGVWYEHRPVGALPSGGSDTEVLQAADSWLKPFMEQNGYRTADVIRVTPETPNLPAIRDKFLREHTHSEDEVRFF